MTNTDVFDVDRATAKLALFCAVPRKTAIRATRALTRRPPPKAAHAAVPAVLWAVASDVRRRLRGTGCRALGTCRDGLGVATHARARRCATARDARRDRR